MDLKALNPNGNAFLVSFTKAKKTYKKFISPTLNDLGLTHNEFEILVFLQENLEYNTAKDIVEFSGLSKGLISRSIESLLKKEMLSIKKDDKDKRIFRLYISPSANETLNVLNKVSNRFFKLLLEDLKDDINEIGKDIICPVLNLFDDDGLTENIKDNLEDLRRNLEKQIPIIEKAPSAKKFHSVNNFLVFMTDEGDINFHKMRKEFRFNALKTIVIKKKEKNYRFLKGKNRNNPSEDVLEIKNQDVERQIFFPANRLVVGNVFTPFPITQTDILFRENFVKKKFNGSDMEVIKNKLDGAYNGEIILGKYNNLNELGGIIGQSPLVIKVYPISLGEEEQIEKKEKKVISFGITKNIYSLKN